MKRALPFLALATVMVAADAPTGPIKARNDAEKPKFVFSFAPKSMTANPTLDMTVVTELTAEGKSRPVPTASSPTYYVGQPGGFRQMGSVAGNEKPPAPEQMQSIVERALSRNGFLPSDDAHPASLVVVYHWGSFARADTSNPDSTTATAQEMLQDLFDRALLTGGEKFATELKQAMAQRINLMDSQPKERQDPDGMMKSVGGDFSSPIPGSFFDPVEQLMARDKRTRFLAEQADTSLYYVVASGFDYAAMAKGQRVLLWRTKMTVDSKGVSLMQTLPTLVASAAEYIGREMDGPATLVQSVREGRVELGEATIVGDDPTKPAKK